MPTLPWRGKPWHERALISDSVFKQPRANAHIDTDVIHRPCCLGGVGSALISLPSPREGAERRKTLLHSLAPRRRCRVPCGHAASRRSTCGVFHPGTVLPGPERRGVPHVIRAAFADPSSGPVQPLKAALRSKGGREPEATRTGWLRQPAARAPHLAPPTKRLRKTPSVEQDGATIRWEWESASRAILFARSVNIPRGVGCGFACRRPS